MNKRSSNPIDKLLKATEIARILNISRAMAYRLIQTGEIRSVRIGAARRVRPEDLAAYIETNQYPA
jgi:excisionase family DNA binding protein